ncbi:predicted protein [Histoplasma mississippiense (nom. inval.)]|uniref:predicted protein n=1 Tax=Ajellomyces capsulatus (strain NAm1 / WU24) TaxID=2059318 RepID=UPI000157B5B4|nr:predicted protein [Histoplasma mississippiense (nom. inval.)]EDN02414.1 predicted protein [Histoplasma mississippiense (nom. inval.)]
MEPSTPSRPPKDIETAYTRPLEPESPANFVAGKAGKRQRKTVTMPPPVLKGASDSIPTATSRLQKQFEGAQQQQNLQQKALIRLAKTLDSWVEEEKQPVSQNFARIFCERFVKYVTADLSAASILRGGAAPDTHPQPNAAKTAAREPTTWAGVAQRGENSALPGVAPAKTAASSAGRASGASLQPKSASQPGGPTGGTKQQEDPRVLVTLQPEKRVARLQPYAVRQAIVANIQGVVDVANVPKVEPTRTGWAITPSDRGIRDALTIEKAVATLCEVLGATEIRLPERWYNYAVPGVPESVQDWEGARIPTDKMIEGEVLAQAKVKPVSYRPSRHGVNPKTGKITWIVSFLAPVKGFSLFNASERARLIEKRPLAVRHNPGCQMFCHPPKCARLARCSNCSEPTSQHEGPTGAECKRAPRCANCCQPYPAGHQHCPAAPRRVNGTLRRLTQKELAAVRRLGDRCHRDAQERQPPPAQPAPMVAVVVPPPTTQSTQSTQPAGLAPRKRAATQSSISEEGATWQMARTRRRSARTAVRQHSQAAKEQSDSSMQTAGLEAFNLIPQVDFGSSSPSDSSC